jgi:DNA-binding transcriptional regulator YdaS (Cro superfamily)
LVRGLRTKTEATEAERISRRGKLPDVTHPTIEEWANRIGVTPAVVRQWENGERPIHEDDLPAIVKASRMTPVEVHEAFLLTEHNKAIIEAAEKAGLDAPVTLAGTNQREKILRERHKDMKDLERTR